MTNRDWDKLVPAFRELLHAIFQGLRDLGHRPFLIEGWRSSERQQALYALNTPTRTVTKADGIERKSRHQSGEAADVGFLDEDGLYLNQLRGDAIEYRTLGHLAEARGLRWGGRFGADPAERGDDPLELRRVGWDAGHVELITPRYPTS